jgi:hypothetical protein
MNQTKVNLLKVRITNTKTLYTHFLKLQSIKIEGQHLIYHALQHMMTAQSFGEGNAIFCMN